ncbi:MAG: hypothetical protein HY292_17850, partial [Planctomycetes bacterium]|nr:hypothetical protein [Planctomycetota bacterium]
MRTIVCAAAAFLAVLLTHSEAARAQSLIANPTTVTVACPTSPPGPSVTVTTSDGGNTTVTATPTAGVGVNGAAGGVAVSSGTSGGSVSFT